MSLNIQLLKQRMSKIADNPQTKEIKYLDLDINETKTFRFLPMEDGSFCKEYYLYYGIAANYFIAPSAQSGKPDPVAEQLEKDQPLKLSYDYMKNLTPKLRCVAPILVRGEEEKGIQIFTFNKFVYLDIMRMITTDERLHNATDPQFGIDFTVTRIIDPEKGYKKIIVKPTGYKTTPLFSNPNADLTSFLDTMPEIDEIYTEYDYDKMTEILSYYVKTHRPFVASETPNKPWNHNASTYTSTWGKGVKYDENVKPF